MRAALSNDLNAPGAVTPWTAGPPGRPCGGGGQPADAALVSDAVDALLGVDSALVSCSAGNLAAGLGGRSFTGLSLPRRLR